VAPRDCEAAQEIEDHAARPNCRRWSRPSMPRLTPVRWVKQRISLPDNDSKPFLELEPAARTGRGAELHTLRCMWSIRGESFGTGIEW